MRLAPLCAFGAALICAAFLVACGGGGGSSPIAGGSMTGSHAAGSNGPGTTLTIVIHRGNAKKYLTKSAPRHRGLQAARRNPTYISGNAEGLQVTVSASGVASQTIYADLTGSLCNTSGPVSTCTVNVPTIAANEQFSMLEVNNAPIGTNGSYGTGFASGSEILGAVTQAQTVTLGAANALTMQIGPVDDGFYDVSCYFSVPTPLPSPYTANYGIDGSGVNNAGFGFDEGARVVVTQGVAATGPLQIVAFDASGDCFFDATPAPFVDVNGSPTPMTVTSSNSALTVAPVFRNSTAPPSNAFGQTSSIPNDGYMWDGCNFVILAQSSASFTSPATITLNNNLTALNAFLSPPSSYANTITWTVVPISVSPTTATVSHAAGTAIVTGSDFGAASGMVAESAYGQEDSDCNSSLGATLANVSSNGSINTTTWQQGFTITGAGGGTGTCTFVLYDDFSGVITQAVTVTVN